MAGKGSMNLHPKQSILFALVALLGISGYVLIYEVQQEYVLILAVKHQREAQYS